MPLHAVHYIPTTYFITLSMYLLIPFTLPSLVTISLFPISASEYQDFKVAGKFYQNLPVAVYKFHCTYYSVLVTFRDSLL